MTIYRTDPAAIRLLQLLLFLTAGLLGLAAAFFLSSHPMLLRVILTGLTGVSLLLGLVGLPLHIRSIRYLVTPSQITMQSGVLFRREQSVRLQNVQFVQILHGPWDGASGLNFMILHVYGGKLRMLFLSRHERCLLTDFLRMKGVFHAP